MKKLSLILFSIIILINFSFINSSEKNVVKGKARIIDGDTIEINKEKIRFGGINSPERKEIGYRLAKDKLVEKKSSDTTPKKSDLSSKSSELKGKNIKDLTDKGFKFPTLIHKNSFTSKNTKIGEGSQIFNQSVVNSGTSIGAITVINTSTIVEHDCKIEGKNNVFTGSF